MFNKRIPQKFRDEINRGDNNKPFYSAPNMTVWNSEELTEGSAQEILESNNGYYNS